MRQIRALAALALLVALSACSVSSASGSIESRREFASKIEKTYRDDNIPLVAQAVGTDAKTLVLDGSTCRMIDIGVARYQADPKMHDTLRSLGFRHLTVHYSDPAPRTIEVDLTR